MTMPFLSILFMALMLFVNASRLETLGNLKHIWSYSMRSALGGIPDVFPIQVRTSKLLRAIFGPVHAAFVQVQCQAPGHPGRSFLRRGPLEALEAREDVHHCPGILKHRQEHLDPHAFGA